MARERDLSKYDSITIEPSKGETYCDPTRVTAYGHFTYGRSSVLAGQPGRQHLGSFLSVEEAQAQYPTAEAQDHSSHIPVADLTRHLPDEPDLRW